MANESPCRSCWWQEGGRCYEGDPKRLPDGRSTVKAEGLCIMQRPRWTILNRPPKDGRLTGAVAESAARQVPDLERFLSKKPSKKDHP
jgi:hypothetical protein